MDRRDFLGSSVATLMAGTTGIPLPSHVQAQQPNQDNGVVVNNESFPERFELRIARNLVPLFRPERDDYAVDAIRELRKRLFEVNLQMPLIRIRDDKRIEPNGYVILSHGIVLVRGSLEPDSVPLPNAFAPILESIARVVNEFQSLLKTPVTPDPPPLRISKVVMNHRQAGNIVTN